MYRLHLFDICVLRLIYLYLDIQEAKRIFGTFSNFGLAASMISVILGIIPLYTYCLQTGGRYLLYFVR